MDSSSWCVDSVHKTTVYSTKEVIVRGRFSLFNPDNFLGRTLKY